MVGVVRRQPRKILDIKREEHPPLGRRAQQLRRVRGVPGHPRRGRAGDVVPTGDERRMQCFGGGIGIKMEAWGGHAPPLPGRPPP